MRQLRTSFLAIVVFLLSARTVRGVDVVAPLASQPSPVGVLFPPSDQSVVVSVIDQRTDRNLIGGGIMGPGVESGKGIYLLYATETDTEIAAHFKSAAEDAVKVLGFKVGEGGLRLEITIEDFWIDMYRMSGFGPMNCIAYGSVRTKLSAPDLAEPLADNLKLTFWDDTVPAGSMKEVAKEAVSRIYAQSAWQAVAATLLNHRNLRADEEQVRRVLEQPGLPKDKIPARLAIFWVGITRPSGSPVKDKLLAILARSEEQRLRQAAAEALGLLGAVEAAPEMVAILGGKKVGDWDVSDAEQVWYLLQGLALLGEKDLKSKVPPAHGNDLRPASKIEDLISFHKEGKPPAMSEAEAEKLAKAKSKLAKKKK